MRCKYFLPRDFKKFFFCKNGLTNDIYHKPSTKLVIHHYDGTKTRTDGCSDKRVRLFESGDYCRMCYRKQCGNVTAGTKKMLCKTSGMGCPSCSEPICKACWEEGYDMHMKLPSS